MASTSRSSSVSTIDVGRKFKGKKIRDVNVTLQTSGNGATAAIDLDAFLTAPNGATVNLFVGLSGQSVGPLTFDDESPFNIGFGPPCVDPTALCPPYIGTGEPLGQLATMDGGQAKGTWTLQVLDDGTTATRASILNLWQLNVTAGKPYKTN